MESLLGSTGCKRASCWWLASGTVGGVVLLAAVVALLGYYLVRRRRAETMPLWRATDPARTTLYGTGATPPSTNPRAAATDVAV